MKWFNNNGLIKNMPPFQYVRLQNDETNKVLAAQYPKDTYHTKGASPQIWPSTKIIF